MREIEFRGYSDVFNGWIYGDLIHDTEDIIKIKIPNYRKDLIDKSEDYGVWKVDSTSVGQYTGLKDKNGKKIFEGDILEDGYPVVYGDWNCGCCANIYGYELGFDSRYNLEVIGNIYENSELLMKR